MSALCNFTTILLVLSMTSSSRSLVIRRNAPHEETTSVTVTTGSPEVTTSKTSNLISSPVADAPNQIPVLDEETSESSEVNNILGAILADYEASNADLFWDSQIQDESDEVVDVHLTEAATVDSSTTSTVASTTSTVASTTPTVASTTPTIASTTSNIASTTLTVASTTPTVASTTPTGMPTTSTQPPMTSRLEAVTSPASVTTDSSLAARSSHSAADIIEPQVTPCQEPPEDRLRLDFRRNNRHLRKFPALAILPQEVAPHQGAGQVELPPPVEEFVNLTCPTELLHVSGIDEVNKRSLCPWTYVADVDPDRYPSTIQIAKCRCPRCIDTSLSQGGAFSNENDCHQVLFRMKVLRRGPCVNGMYMYHNVYQDIPVACTCLRPKV